MPALLVAIALCSCVAPSHPPPKSTNILTGNVSAGSFVYLAAKAKELAPNQVASIGGPISFERNIDSLVADAVNAKLGSRGIRLENTGKTLSGVIQVCRMIKYIGAPTDCSLSIKYQVSAGGSVTYETTKEVSTRQSFDTQLALEDVIERNISQLLEDRAFLNAIR